MGSSRMESIRESNPSRNRSVSPCLTLGESNSQKRARTRAESTRSIDLFCPAASVTTRRTQRRTSRSPSIESACRTEWDLAGKAEAGGVHVAQQAITQRGLALDGVFDLPLQFGLVNYLQHLNIVELVAGDSVCFHRLRPAEKIPLKVSKARLLGGHEFFACFHLLGQHAAAPGSVALDHGRDRK